MIWRLSLLLLAFVLATAGRGVSGEEEEKNTIRVVAAKEPECEEVKRTYAVYGASGETGWTVVDYLLSQNQNVVVVAKPNSPWAEVKEVTVRQLDDMEDASTIAKAFADVDGAFVLPPMPYKSENLLQDALKTVKLLRRGLEKADVPKLVLISSIGAHLDPSSVSLGHIEVSHHVEKEFEDFPNPVTFLRPAWLIDNFKTMAKSVAEKQGVLPSFLTDMDKKREMVCSFDVGVWGAKLLTEKWTGVRIVELQGPSKISPADVAKAVSKALSSDEKERSIRPIPVLPSKYQDVFKSVMSKDAIKEWSRTMEGLNSGKIKFEGGASKTLLGETPLDDFVRTWFEGGNDEQSSEDGN